jgi:hypothetical protein
MACIGGQASVGIPRLAGNNSAYYSMLRLLRIRTARTTLTSTPLHPSTHTAYTPLDYNVVLSGLPQGSPEEILWHRAIISQRRLDRQQDPSRPARSHGGDSPADDLDAR